MALIDFILHIDIHLAEMAADYGVWLYAVLFAIVFCETGLVVTPFLPGDSLLFAAGALSGLGALELLPLSVLIFVAAVLGDTVNYWIGERVGPEIFKKDTGRLLNKDHLQKAHDFYEKHGGKAIVLARFVPIVRTFAPFVAGIGKMSYARFFAYNVVGAFIWVAIFVGAGHFFGNMPEVKKNFSLVILAIIIISVLPIIFEFIKARRDKSA